MDQNIAHWTLKSWTCGANMFYFKLVVGWIPFEIVSLWSSDFVVWNHAAAKLTSCDCRGGTSLVAWLRLSVACKEYGSGVLKNPKIRGKIPMLGKSQVQPPETAVEPAAGGFGYRFCTLHHRDMLQPSGRLGVWTSRTGYQSQEFSGSYHFQWSVLDRLDVDRHLKHFWPSFTFHVWSLMSCLKLFITKTLGSLDFSDTWIIPIWVF